MMRNSQVTLLSALGAVLLLIVIIVGVMRLTLSGFVGDANAGAGDNDARDVASATLSPNLVDFDRIVVRGTWLVELRRGSTWNVDLIYPDDRAGELEVGVRDGALVLDRADGGGARWNWWGRNEGPFQARITLPALAGIEIAGAGSVELTGFEGERLTLAISGAGNIEGSASSYERLELAVGGAANVDLNDVPVTDAVVNLSGAANVELRMNGGTLTGSLSGIGHVGYKGPVTREAVTVSGFGRVSRSD